MRTTIEVESAIAATLNAIVIFLEQNLHDEKNASTAASNIAISPPYKSSDRKTNVSETATCVLTRGIFTVAHDPRPIVEAAMIRKYRSNFSRGRSTSARAMHPRPIARTATI
jgi:hypothetical protein